MLSTPKLMELERHKFGLKFPLLAAIITPRFMQFCSTVMEKCHQTFHCIIKVYVATFTTHTYIAEWVWLERPGRS